MIAAAPIAASIPSIRFASAISMPGLLGCYFAFRVCITFLLFQSDPPTGAAVSVALNIFLLLPAAVYAFGPARLSRREAFNVQSVRLVLAFLGLALLSIV